MKPKTPQEMALAKRLEDRYFTPVKPAQPPTETFRSYLKRIAGDKGEGIWDAYLSIARGQAWIPTLPDGREGPPQVPTTSDRLVALRQLEHALFGSAVGQDRVPEAEKAAAEAANLTAMTDEELYAKAREAFERVKAQALPAGDKEDE